MKQSFWFTFTLLTSAVLFSNCSNDNFAKYNQLGDLRVLGLIVDQPEVSPGTTVNITPVLSDMSGAGRTLNYFVQACADPGIGIGTSVTCLSPDAGNTKSGTVTIPAGASQTYTDAVASFSIVTPASAAILSSRSAADQYNGIAYLVFYTISSVDRSANVTSFVRVIVSGASKPTKNQNPVITSLNANDAAVGATIAQPSANTNFSVTSPPSSAETYQTMTAAGDFKTQTESLVNTWFSSDGTFDFQRNFALTENSWAPPNGKPAGRGVVFMVITRDNHNGSAFKKLELN